jgi:AcrR family transcriptional regulator
MSVVVDMNEESVLTPTDMKTTRKYTMGARAQAVEETRRRILQAVIALSGERPFAEITLDAVAERAGVSVQTVLRQFGSRDSLVAEGTEVATAEILEERRAPAGDIPAAMRNLADHYERLGQTALLMLAQEGHDDLARKVTDRGKAMHRDWVQDAFAPATRDDRVLDLLVVATDVYTWKLLRIDRGHSRAVTERRMHDLVDAVLASITSKEH